MERVTTIILICDDTMIVEATMCLVPDFRDDVTASQSQAWASGIVKDYKIRVVPREAKQISMSNSPQTQDLWKSLNKKLSDFQAMSSSLRTGFVYPASNFIEPVSSEDFSIAYQVLEDMDSRLIPTPSFARDEQGHWRSTRRSRSQWFLKMPNALCV